MTNKPSVRVSMLCIFPCILLLIGIGTALYVRSTIKDAGIDEVRSSHDLEGRNIELAAVWGMENEEAVFQNLQESVTASLARIDKADLILIVHPDDIFEQRSGYLFQCVTVDEVLRTTNNLVKVGESIWLYRYGGFASISGHLTYTDTQGIFLPGNKYLVFLMDSPLNEYANEKTYSFASTEFSSILPSSGFEQAVCHSYDMGENMCNEDFCASERILTLFQEVKSTILYRYQELSPELMAIERSVPPQLQLLIERKTEYIPKFETKTSLTEQEVMWFAEHYFNDDNGTNFFLQEAFTSPEKINLGIVFSYGLEPFKKYIATEATLNPEEQRAVEQMAPDALEFGITKIAIADMDVVLMELTGLTSADMKGYGLNSLYYLEDYHAYYSTNGASGYSEMPVMIDSGYRTDTGYIVLQYRQGMPNNKYLQSSWEVVLQEYDGKFLLYSNMEAEA